MRVPGGPNPIRKRGGKTLVHAIQRRLIKEEAHKPIDEALEQSAVDALAVARELSSGTVDSRSAGRPYSKAHQNKTFDPNLINIGVGNKKKHPGKRFADSWELLPASQGPGIRNTSWVGPYLEQKDGGSSKGRMVARRVDEPIRKRLDVIVRANLTKAFSDGTFVMPATSWRLAAQ